MHDAVFDAAQLDVAAVRGHVGAHTVQRLPHAILHRHGMKPVQEEQIARFLVLRDLLHDRLPGVARRDDDFEHSLDAAAVQFEERLNDFLRDRPRSRVGERLDLMNQCVEPLHPLLEAIALMHHTLPSVPSGLSDED